MTNDEHWVLGKLTKTGRGAFERLCERCDRDFLLIRLGRLAQKSVDLGQGRVIHFFPHDSWRNLFPGVRSKKELREDLNAISDRASGFIKDLHRLRRSGLVRLLNDEGFIPRFDLLSLGRSPVMALPDIRDGSFRTIRDLPQIAEKVLKTLGPRQRPDRRRALSEVYHHIHERTGKWCDALLCDILNGLEPHGENPRHSEGSLKQWRYKRGLTQAK